MSKYHYLKDSETVSLLQLVMCICFLKFRVSKMSNIAISAYPR